MIRHIVLLDLDAEPAALDAAVAALRALPDAIAEIEAYDVGLDAGLSDGNASLGIVADFADEAAWAAYRDHPEHHRVIDEHLKPMLRARSAVQVRR